MNSNSSIGERIRTERKKRKLTVRKVEKTCNIPYGKLSKIERDKILLSIYYIPKLSELLEIPIEELNPIKNFECQPVGTKIAYYRKINGLTQKNLSDITGIYSSTISHIERGSWVPREDKLQKIADALGVKISDLY